MGAVEITSCHDNPGQPLLHINRSDAESGEKWERRAVVPNPAVGKSGVCNFRSAGQGVATRNDYFIPGSCNAAICPKNRVIRSAAPMHSVSYVVGYIKVKSAKSIARRFMGKAKNFTGENFWARGYFVSTVGLDEEMVREYIRHREEEDEHYDQLKLGM
jgi:hypothetical protein